MYYIQLYTPVLSLILILYMCFSLFYSLYFIDTNNNEGTSDVDYKQNLDMDIPDSLSSLSLWESFISSSFACLLSLDMLPLPI